MEAFLTLGASRAEEFGETLVKYFAQPSFYNSLFLNKAAILVGGRGSGKTHVLRSLSLMDVANSDNKERIEEYWTKNNFIGCYIKMDSNLVSSFKDKGLTDDEWKDIFSHFINLRLTHEILKALKIVNEHALCNWDYKFAFDRLSEILCPCENILDLEDAISKIKKSIDAILGFTSNPQNYPRPQLIMNGLLIFEFCTTLMNRINFPRKTFFILIDEFESLHTYQQIIINTLVKKNEPPVIFKLAMRPNGWFTRETSSTNEILQEPADFDEINFENISNQDYEKLIKEIYHLRFSVLNLDIDIEKIFPQLPPEQEAADLFKNRKPKHTEKINKLLHERYPSEKAEELYSKIVNSNNYIESRLNLVLLERGNDPEDIAYHYLNKTTIYNDWYHNNYLGVLFILCREASTRKKYTGFKTFCLLSSKIIRNFVVLFNRTLELTGNTFNKSNPEAFSFNNQDRAAYETSMSQVFEIETLPVYGNELSLFTHSIGRLFEELQKNPLQSEPEQSHFSIKNGTISCVKAKELFEFAVRWSVIQEVDSTKLKSPNNVRGKDYMLNRIYCPYYQISYRKKRKLEISANELEKLLIGTKEERNFVFSSIRRTHSLQENIQPGLNF